MTCPTCGKRFAAHQCMTSETVEPELGDCGVCSGCLAWWEMTEDGIVTYTPTDDEFRRLLAFIQSRN